MYAASVLKSMLGQATTGVIPVDLLTTNRILERWAVTHGSGLPTDRWDDSRLVRPPPLDDDSATVIDLIVRNCPPITKRTVDGWFRRPIPTFLLAKEMGMSPRALEKNVLLSLNFVKWKIECSNHLTLVRLLKVRVMDT